MRDDTLLSRFPKQRSELPEAYRKIYAEHYKRNREGSSTASSVSQRMESWMHRKVAEDVLHEPIEKTTLEVGAGNLNHLPYEPAGGRYDVLEPLSELVENSPHYSRVADVYRDWSEIPEGHYDRIVSVAAFEHFCDLPNVVSRCASLLAPGGQLRIGVPSEGTLLWRLGWKFTTGLEFRLKYHLDYGVLMKHEHVNTAAEIEAVLKIYFESVQRWVLGVSPSLSLYQFFQCRLPDTTKSGRI
jgi:SAM-dependent methyltransferase